ncbi:DUF547 domain-containing protein [Hymenobacter endophyticus]|uniref:DUF547 domain-containing protein n=1 Tax=Hymenobacter endophyticus TaxID=3076335 RepID=A0ABU3TK76_9BACT|nr:DUF547 domain-containing protein [Hymenobacter endophyticus]MDU0371768.1 DUF547 domain-containing protein [Hymenobacter endophyticus]
MPATHRFLVRFFCLLLGGLLLATSGYATTSSELQAPWNTLLHRYVTPDGRLDYAGLLDEEDELLGYLQGLRKVKPDPQTWPPADTEAFWINTYNAAATYLILQYYPVASINDIRVKVVGGTKTPWEAPVVNVGGQNYSLNQIEREMLRNQFHDPRVHFALMYGAASAPAILAEAYDGARLSQQLDQQARRFLNDPAFNQLSPQQVQLSGLFEAYGAEFGSEAQLLEFVNQYARVPVLPTAKVEYLSFSWALNDRTGLSSSQALGKQ